MWRHGALFSLFGRAIFVKPSRQRRRRRPHEKNSVNQLFFLLSKAPLFTPSAGRGGWYPILGHLGICFLGPPCGGRGCHTSPKILIPQPSGGRRPTPKVPRFVKKWLKTAKIGQNRHRENRIWATFSLGGRGGPPLSPGVQKRRNPGHFLQGKNRNWVNIFRGSGPPTPMALYTPRALDPRFFAEKHLII